MKQKKIEPDWKDIPLREKAFSVKIYGKGTAVPGIETNCPNIGRKDSPAYAGGAIK